MKNSKSSKNKVSKKIQKFINSIADVVDTKGMDDLEDVPQSYVSKVDGSYLTFVGLENDLKYLMKLGITEQIQSSPTGSVATIGFNPTEQKWYGWSHRAIFGFGIGSSVKKGDCGYNPDNKETFLEGLKRGEEKTHKTEYIVKEDGVLCKSTFLGYDEDFSQDKFIGNISEQLYNYPEKWGKGEWTAETIEDAKQMAIDFARSVS